MFNGITYSYVMSLMPRRIIDELRLKRHGYRVYSVGPSYYAFAQFSRKDAAAHGEWRERLGELAVILDSLLLTTPPKVGSSRRRGRVGA